MYCWINSEFFCLFYYLINADIHLVLLFRVACSNLDAIFCFFGTELYHFSTSYINVNLIISCGIIACCWSFSCAHREEFNRLTEQIELQPHYFLREDLDICQAFHKQLVLHVVILYATLSNDSPIYL